jgi:uncharacterized protein
MFSKKPQLAVQTAAPAPADASARPLPRIAKLFANPYVGAGAAAGLLVLSIGVLILVGDPRAGAPVVKAAIGEDSSLSAPVEVTSLADPNDPLLAGLEGLATSETMGDVVVTLPDGQRQTVGGAPRAGGLVPAPIAGLHQPGPGGLLPIVSADGRTAAQAYARPFTPNGKPRVAVVIGGLGIDPATTRRAIETLPPEVTLSFAVYAEGLQGWIDMARAYGHEVLLEAPMEPKTFPQDDPGPQTLMANARPDDTLRRLDTLLAKASGYFGVTNYMGSKFVASTGAMETFAQGLKKRGLAFVDDGSAIQKGGGIPRASADRIIDDQPGAEAIARRLAEIEVQATKRGSALASGFGYPSTVAEVARWAQGLQQKGYQLAPASALTVRR